MKVTKWFRFAPFLNFVMANGSMVLGSADESSDFDVLIGTREGRIFTLRYILNFIFSILRARRLDDVKGSSPDKLCFNHFVTPEAYHHSELNEYGVKLYRNLVPLCGDEKEIKKFFEANRGYGIDGEMNVLDLRFSSDKPNSFARFLEFLLSGRFGDFIEKKVAKPIARRRLSKYLSRKTLKERVIVSDKELEFHFELQ